MGIINRISYYACRIKDSFRTNVFRLNENIKIGRKSVVHSNALLKINNGGKISIGKNSEILFGSVIMTYGGSISIGDRCSINPYSIIYGHGNAFYTFKTFVLDKCDNYNIKYFVDEKYKFNSSKDAANCSP